MEDNAECFELWEGCELDLSYSYNVATATIKSLIHYTTQPGKKPQYMGFFV
jgi:hypothetical protein